ncbi:MAG: XdhC family protein [Woeseiaceae bacterium]|nr:XdhC family protein [Woeseiaceae bacterium]
MNDLASFFRARREAGAPLVLATVIDTQGSTYSKSGSRLLVDGEGVYRGLLSGGCLEGDLAIRAAQVIETGVSQLAEYDFADDDDELWGMGVGCDGSLKILLQPVTAETNYEPYAAIDAVLESDASAVLVTAVEPEGGVQPGASVLVGEQGTRNFGVPEPLLPRFVRAAERASSVRRSGLAHSEEEGAQVLLHCSFIEPPPRLLILGAGPDVEPLLRFASELGWRCTIVDHRPAYIESGAFEAAWETHCLAPSSLRESLALEVYDRAVVMSHHLPSDREYLRQIADSDINYVGLLGPPARRDRLLSDLGSNAEKLAKRLHGPAGLNIRARGPAAIALSIVAQIQQLLH